MHTILVVAILIGISLLAIGMLSTGALDMISSSLAVNSIQITQLDIIDYDDKPRISLTVKNTGSSTISGIIAIVTIGSEISNDITIAEAIDKGESGSVREILTVDGSSTVMTGVAGQDVLVEISGTAIDGSVVNVNTVKTKIK